MQSHLLNWLQLMGQSPGALGSLSELVRKVRACRLASLAAVGRKSTAQLESLLMRSDVRGCRDSRRSPLARRLTNSACGKGAVQAGEVCVSVCGGGVWGWGGGGRRRSVRLAASGVRATLV